MTLAVPGAWVAELAQRHLDAAYNLGRWLLGNEQDAADAVHDAYVRATRSAHTYAGGNARAWWLAIVRNCCLAMLSARGRDRRVDSDRETIDAGAEHESDVETKLYAEQQRSLLEQQLRALPIEFREALILREIEDLSYREIADVLQVPIGTVMSRLSRGRALLQRAFASNEENAHGL